MASRFGYSKPVCTFQAQYATGSFARYCVRCRLRRMHLKQLCRPAVPPYQVPPYSFPTNPYPAQQAQYQFQGPPQQHPQQQHQVLQPPQLRQHQHQPPPQYLQSFNTPAPLHPPLPPPSQRPEARPPQTSLPPPPSSTRPAKKRRGPAPRPRANRNQVSSQHGASSHRRSPDNGPGAPPPESNTPDNIEEELINALQGGGSDQGLQNNRNGDDDDDDQDQDGEGDENEPVFQLPPPPEGNYANEKELEQQMHAWTLDHGYECVRRASKKNARGVVYKRYYHCSRHGKKSGTVGPEDSARKRAKKKTGRLGCQMSLAAVAVDPTNPAGEWQIRHRKTFHNHAAENAVTLTGHRRRARGGDVERIIDSLFTIGTPTTQVLRFLEKNHPSGLFTRTDVANMKLKFNKYGTCVKDGLPERSNTAGKGGVPSACLRCRQKRVKCNSVRPTCGTCTTDGTACEYDHEPIEFPTHEVNGSRATPEIDGPSLAGLATQMDQSAEQRTSQTQPRQGRQALRTDEGLERAQRIMSELQSFQAEHVRPTRLALESSAVELLAISSCGNGDLYKSVPLLTSAANWPTYSSLMIGASMKENTYDVLIGIKNEPPVPPTDCEVETWNEYIKQFAIFKRRNDLLLASIWGSLAPSFKTRVAKCKSAAQAWNLVEDMCQPHGSDQAFKAYADLQSITLQTSRDLNDYIQRIEQAYTDLVRIRLYHQQAQDSIGISSTLSTNTRSPSHTNTTNGPTTPAAGPAKRNCRTLGDALDVFPEESLCFLFLTNLGSVFRSWAEMICATNNVGGFGTGVKVGFRELSRRAIEWDAGRRRGGGGSSTDQ
nr:hypothetical protein CFP56_25851 [Quercus suber]